jgi:[CysO sulfur-carrier protein]-S-L-cysteine hydrolase
VKLLLPSDQKARVTQALTRAGTSETGGQLFGEQLAPSSFRITELTVQSRPGTFARFVVDLVDAGRAALAFFRRTAHDYTHHNYIGEWHSHPSFSVKPSLTDANTMRELVRSDDFNGSFAVLIIVRLDGNQLSSGAWLFDPNGVEEAVALEVENDNGE